MPRVHAIAFLLCASSVVCGCAQPTDQSAEIQRLDNKIKGLSKNMDHLSADVASNQRNITTLQFYRQMDDNKNTNVELDPARPGFGRVDANVGTFAVSLDDVHQFADSVRIKIDVGNLSAATFNGATLHLKYGRRQPTVGTPDFATEYPKWSDELRTKDEVISARLLPGHWNPVQIVLPGIEAKDFGYLEVSIETNQIFMY